MKISLRYVLSWNEYISLVAKSTARKIYFLLFRSRRYFTSLQLLTTLLTYYSWALQPFGGHGLTDDPLPYGPILGCRFHILDSEGFQVSLDVILTSHSILILTIYKDQIYYEYSSHWWRAASKHSLATLDAIQKRPIMLSDDLTLTDALNSLTHVRTVSAVSPFYKYYHGIFSDELNSAISPKACFAIHNILSRLNWKNAGPLHSPIRLSL